MPVAGVYTPAAFEPGDMVRVSHIVGTYRAVSLDERTDNELVKRVLAAGKVVEAARTVRDGLRPQVEQLNVDAGRQLRLFQIGAVAQSSWEQASLRYDQAVSELRAAELRAEQLEHEQQALITMINSTLSRGTHIRTPLEGILLRKFVDQERILPIGQPLYEIGTFDSIEIVADVLSADAALMRVGMMALMEAGQAGKITASVRRIEPAAYTKISALGIEEQRVNLVLIPHQTVPLGDAYRVAIKITLWRADRVLRVPSNSIVVKGADTSVFVTEGDRAVLQRVKLGLKSRDFVEVIYGMKKGTTLVVNPPSSLYSGSRISKE
jgi:HlyD family secretion protein